MDRNGYCWPAVVAPRTPAGLIALALASFALGPAEFVIAGLLPNVAHDLSVSSGTAGLLVTTYAIGVIVGAPVVATALSRYPPKRVVVGLVAVFAGVNLLSALGPELRECARGELLPGLPTELSSALVWLSLSAWLRRAARDEQ